MLVALLIVALGPAADPEPPSKKVIASADWYSVEFGPPLTRDHLVLRSTADLVAALPDDSSRQPQPKVLEKVATGAAAKALGVKAIDWKKHTLLVVAAGGQRSHGYRIEVVGLKKKGGTLTVSWVLHEPQCKGDCVKSYPALLVLVPAHAGKVVFERMKE